MQIYKIINLINNKIYVGKDQNNKENYFGSGKLIKQAIKKNGLKNFKKEILEYNIKNKDVLCKREKFWIKKLNSQNPNIGYNISSGGEYGDTFTNNPNKEIIRKKLSKSCKGNKNGFYKKTLLECWINKYGKENADVKMKIYKEKMSKATKGILRSKEAKNNISKGKKGILFSDEHKLHISQSKKGQKMSNECKNKISKTLRGRKFTEEHKKKLSDAQKRRFNT